MAHASPGRRSGVVAALERFLVRAVAVVFALFAGLLAFGSALDAPAWIWIPLVLAWGGSLCLMAGAWRQRLRLVAIPFVFGAAVILVMTVADAAGVTGP